MLHKTFQTFAEGRFVWEATASAETQTEQQKPTPDNLEKKNSNETINKLNNISGKLGNLHKQLENRNISQETKNQLTTQKLELEAQQKTARQEIEQKYGAEKGKLANDVAGLLQKFEANSNEKINPVGVDRDLQEKEVGNLIGLAEELKNRPLTSADVAGMEQSVNALFGQNNETIGRQEFEAMRNALILLKEKVANDLNNADIAKAREAKNAEKNKYESELQGQQSIKERIKIAGDKAIKEATDSMPKAPTKYMKLTDTSIQDSLRWTKDSQKSAEGHMIDFGYNPATEKVEIRINSDGNWKSENLIQELREKNLDTDVFNKFATQVENLNRDKKDGAERRNELAKIIRDLSQNGDNYLFKDKKEKIFAGDVPFSPINPFNKDAPEKDHQILAEFDDVVSKNPEEIRAKAEQAEMDKLTPEQKELLRKNLVNPEEAKNTTKENVTNKTSEESPTDSYLDKNIPGTREEFDSMIEAKYGAGFMGQAMKAIVEIMARYIGIPKIQRNENGELTMGWFGVPKSSAEKSTDETPGKNAKAPAQNPEITKNAKNELSAIDLTDLKQNPDLKEKTRNFINESKDYLATTIAKLGSSFDVDSYIANIKQTVEDIKKNGLSQIEKSEQEDVLDDYIDYADKITFAEYLQKETETNKIKMEVNPKEKTEAKPKAETERIMAKKLENLSPEDRAKEEAFAKKIDQEIKQEKELNERLRKKDITRITINPDDSVTVKPHSNGKEYTTPKPE